MNRKNIAGALFAVAAVLMAGLALTTAGDYAAHFVGKAVWYLPYAALVGAIRSL